MVSVRKEVRHEACGFSPVQAPAECFYFGEALVAVEAKVSEQIVDHFGETTHLVKFSIG